MKKTIKLFLVALFLTSQSWTQSTEKFIRIIGNSKKEIKASKAKIAFSINENKANRYKTDSKDISYAEAYDSAISKLSEIGIKENRIESLITVSKYSKARNYNAIVNFDELEKVSKIESNGFKITSVSYIFDSSNENLETELSLKAINDAKRKAKNICKEINKKVGEILNIEVKDPGISKNKYENSKKEIYKTYKVTITFKLID